MPTDQVYIFQSRGIAEKPSIEKWMQRSDVWLQRWKDLRIYNNNLESEPSLKDAGLIHILILYGFRNLLPLALNSANVNAQGGNYGNTLQAVCFKGY